MSAPGWWKRAGRADGRATAHRRLTVEQELEILRRVRAGETQRAIGAALDLNPVTVGKVARRHGFTYPGAQRNADARRGKTLQQPERDWQRQVLELAELYRWRAYHTWRSDHSTAGFPDLVLVKPPRLIIAELKTDTGEVMPAQDAWLAELGQCPSCEVFVWRPRDWPEVERRLRGDS